jgi:hypothetical protein
MKVHCIFVCAALFLSGCGADLTDSRYTLELPELPPAWTSLLGEPHWKIEWLNTEGVKTMMTVQGGQRPEINLPQTWASAVSALPYWPDQGIEPGVFRPAGAIFPFDVCEKVLALTWRGGVDATLYWEIAQAAADQADDAAARAAVSRLPWNFNWPRFRELFNDPTVNAAVHADPWLADWSSIAAKIVKSGFDKRRLVPEARSELRIPVALGPWIGTSPFAEPLLFENFPVFPVRQEVDTWVSAEGLLHCNKDAWIFYNW